MFKKIFFLFILLNSQKLLAQQATVISFYGIDSFLLNTSKANYNKAIINNKTLKEIVGINKKVGFTIYQINENNDNGYYLDSFKFSNLACYFVRDSILSAITLVKAYKVADFTNVARKVENDKNYLVGIISERLHSNSEFVDVKPSKNKIDYQYLWTKDNNKVCLSIKLENANSDFVIMELSFINKNMMPLKK
jgi:hypothetical protein